MKLTTVLLLLGTFLSISFGSPVKSSRNGDRLITQGGEDPDPEIQAKRNFVKQMMKDSWDEYEKWAWGNNELKPVSRQGQTGGIFGDAEIGATIVDSLDTLHIMEMTEEYDRAREYVQNGLNFRVNETVSIFETIIRFVGGFLSAYALTGDTLYRARANEIGSLLLPGFNSISGLPYGGVNILTGVERDHINALAGIGTLHLEFMYLSEITGRPVFREKAQHILDHLRALNKPKGQYRSFMNVDTGDFTEENHITIGGLSDSYFEYLLKASIQLGDNDARQMYDDAMDAFVDNGLVKTSTQSHLLYIAESRDDKINDAVGHLACFAGGMFALGAHVNPDNKNAVRDAEIGQNFTNTCHEAYIRSTTGIGPEVFRFSDTIEAISGPEGNTDYLLRPEVVESYFVLYRITGDPKYREWGWEAVLAIEKYCKVRAGSGYSGLRNVYSENPEWNDVQETFFLAETLKYLYLLFSSNDLIDLDYWVFNTECHPLPIQGKNPRYAKKFM